MTDLTKDVLSPRKLLDAAIGSDSAFRIRVVERPPTWRKQPYSLTYLFPDRELEPDKLDAGRSRSHFARVTDDVFVV